MASTLTRTPSVTPSDSLSSTSRPISRLPSGAHHPSAAASSSNATTDPRRRPPPPPSPAAGAPAAAAMPPPPPPFPGASPSGFASFASGSGSGVAAAGTNAFTTAAAAGPIPAFAAPSPIPALPTPEASAPREAASRSASAGVNRGRSSSSRPSNPLPSPDPPVRGRPTVIDLTSSSPPPHPRPLVPAAQRSGLAFPGAAGASNVGASTSGAAFGQQPRGSGSGSAVDVLNVADDDTDSDIEYADVPRARGGVRENVRRWASGRGDAPLELSDDSDVEIVSERPADPLPPRHHIASPPPFVVPSGSTSTSAAGPSSNLRSRSTRTARFAADPVYTAEQQSAADAALARRLAAADAAAARRYDVPARRYDDEDDERWAADYVAQARAADHARGGGAGGSRDAPPPRRGGGGYGGIFSRSLGNSYLDSLAAAIPTGLFAYYDGGFWPGGGGAGAGLTGLFGLPAGGYGGAGPSAGWGGAAKVKAASKKYGVRMSHGADRVEKGFTRDIVEPLEEGEAPPPPPPAKKAKTSAKGKATASAVEPDLVVVEEQVPVCASCLDPLFLGGEGARKVFALKCGHVVCAKCLDEARGRCRVAKGTADVGGGRGGVKGKAPAAAGKGKGKKAVKVVPPATRRGSAAKGKGRSVGFSDDVLSFDGGGLTPSELDAFDGGAGVLSSSSSDDDGGSSSEYEPLSRASSSTKGKGKRAAPAPSAKAKGKARSRSDETGVEEEWTTCPASSCDGKGGDVLAEEGWARPYELFV
ncbi:hypothetical protein JCM6882_004693 [Rhodosporidiobolus microsporus]